MCEAPGNPGRPNGIVGGAAPATPIFPIIAEQHPAVVGMPLMLIAGLLAAPLRNLGYALALGMITITGVSNATYIWLRSRSNRWLR